MRAGWWLLVVVVAAAVYLPGVDNGFLYDDHELITKPEAPAGVSDLLAVFGERHWYNLPYYRPLSRLSYVAQKGLHGNEPLPYHVFNTLLVAALAVLAWILLRAPPFGIAAPPAWLAAAVFAMHPIASSGVWVGMSAAGVMRSEKRPYSSM